MKHLTERGPRAGVLVIQPLPGIGDMIWHLPHIHALAKHCPEGRVSILTKPRSLADRLLCADPAVDRILWLERNPGRHDGLLGFFRLLSLLREHRFRQVWILHGSGRYAWAAWLAGIPERVGYGIGGQRYLLSTEVGLPAGHRRSHPIVKADLLLDLIGLERDEPEPQLRVSLQADRQVIERYGADSRPWIALGVGSSEPCKQWGAENFAELALALHRSNSGRLFIVGGPAERTLADAILSGLRQGGGAAADAVALPIDQTAALLARCRCYVGNDTGVLNMAAALAIPSLGLFGGSQPLRHSRYIHPVTPPLGTAGMAAITVARVLAEIPRLETHRQRLEHAGEPAQSVF